MINKPAIPRTLLKRCLAFVIFTSLLSSAAWSSQVKPQSIPYGKDKLQTFDLYSPKKPQGAPIIFMVHGGAWRFGDKAAVGVVKNKLARWVPKDFIFISVNYRLLPGSDPLEQAGDIATALAYIQKNGGSWGADPGKIILMGHSAGAHLVTLLATSTAIVSGHDLKPWLGTISIDTAAFDIVALMERDHYRFYDRVFGDDKNYWKSVSPQHFLEKPQQPLLAICSTQRKDNPCETAETFARKALMTGMRVEVLKVDLSHKEANTELGRDTAYTEKVEFFMKGLDDSVEKLLRNGKAR
ncbi:MAG: alpha/beta hydrolase [Pseudomonadales bacterium]|nr:alpha/beta hydrolase [Pseudomonadales bacterium]